VQAAKSAETKNISIYNNLGELVGKYQIEPWDEEKTLDVSSLSMGVFFLPMLQMLSIYFLQRS
jgi:hypothetical protein